MNEPPDLYRIQRRFQWCRRLAALLMVHSMAVAMVHTHLSVNARRGLAVIPLVLACVCMIFAHKAYAELARLVTFHEYLSSNTPVFRIPVPPGERIVGIQVQTARPDPSKMN